MALSAYDSWKTDDGYENTDDLQDRFTELFVDEDGEGRAEMVEEYLCWYPEDADLKSYESWLFDHEWYRWVEKEQERLEELDKEMRAEARCSAY